jgi:AraC-like DNA-binding protein
MKNISFNFFETFINNINIEILEHGYLYADNSWKHYNITSHFNRLYLITDGEGFVKGANCLLKLEKGYAYLLPNHSTFDYICDSSLQKFYIHFRMEVLSGFDIFEFTDKCLRLPVDKEIAYQIISCAKGSRVQEIMKCKLLLFELLLNFMELLDVDLSLQLQHAFRYKKLFEYVKYNCYADININELAQFIGLSYSQLSKGFKEDIGLNIKSFINLKLIQSAKDKLLLSDMNIKEISQCLRFNDEFYFSRFFKKHVGISPKEYRMKNKL